jgi:PAS domain S-box-containing protein
MAINEDLAWSGAPIEGSDGFGSAGAGPNLEVARIRHEARSRILESELRLAEELAAAKVLQRISTELMSEQEPEALYDKLLDAAIELNHADFASLQILSSGGSSLRLLATKGFPPNSTDYWNIVESGSGSSCGQAIKHNRAIVVPDVERSEALAGTEDLEALRLSGIRAMQSTPLISRDGRPIGMISTHWRTPREPDANGSGLYDVLVRQAADLIDRMMAQEALRESEQRFRHFAEASSDVIWIRNADTLEAEFLSSAFETVFGFPREEVRHDARRLIGQIVPDDRDAALARLEQVRQGRPSVHEFRIRRPSDGAFRWIRNTDFALFDETGRVQRIGGIASDVTEATQSAEHQAVLVGELQHRVRNIMSMIQSMTVRTAETAPSVDDYAELLAGRLMALARTQVLLTRAANAGVNVGELVRQELEAVSEGEGRYETSGPDVTLSPKGTEVLSLAIHELATNALKHGALSEPDGSVGVAWRITRQDGAAWLSLTWTEARAAPADWTAPVRRGFGTALVERRVPYELGGRGRIEVRPEGARALIEFPLETGASILETDAPIRTSAFGGSIDMSGEPRLEGRRVLVIEDDFYLAGDTEGALLGAGAQVIGPFGREEPAIEAILREAPHAAVVDINLGSGASFEAARVLDRAGVPFVFLTGYDQTSIPDEFAGVTRLQKPIELRQVVRAVAEVVQAP